MQGQSEGLTFLGQGHNSFLELKYENFFSSQFVIATEILKLRANWLFWKYFVFDK